LSIPTRRSERLEREVVADAQFPSFSNPTSRKAIVGRWFTEVWGADVNPGVIDELAAPDIRFEDSLHAPRRDRDEVGVARVCRLTLAAVADRRRVVMPRASPH
jgi:hypothetical protein